MTKLPKEFFSKIGKKGGEASVKSEKHNPITSEFSRKGGQKSKRPSKLKNGMTLAPFTLDNDEKTLDSITRRKDDKSV